METRMDTSGLRELLTRLKAVFMGRPGHAVSSDSPALAQWRGGLECELTGPGDTRARSSMPRALGGDGDAPSPGWYLRAAQAACLATSIVLQAAEGGIELNELAVECGSESDARGFLGLPGALAVGPLRSSIRVRIGADAADQAQLRQLVETAYRHSPVMAAMRDLPAPEWQFEFVAAAP
jgi:uncharacterized OsmC-like protein